MLVGVHNQLGIIFDIELFENPGLVGTHRLVADIELLRDTDIAFAAQDQKCDIHFFF